MFDRLYATAPARLAAGALLLSISLSAAADEAKFRLGRAVFTEQATPACAVCHTLEDAGATGAVGPNLNELAPTEEQVATAVKSGIGIMPAFESLSPEQVEAVAYYVAKAARGDTD